MLIILIVCVMLFSIVVTNIFSCLFGRRWQYSDTLEEWDKELKELYPTAIILFITIIYLIATINN